MGRHRRFKRNLARREAGKRPTSRFGDVVLRQLSRGKRGLVAVFALHEIRLAGRQRLLGSLDGSQHFGLAGDVSLHGAD